MNGYLLCTISELAYVNSNHVVVLNEWARPLLAELSYLVQLDFVFDGRDSAL